MLRYMKYAYAVYEERSFTAAAKKLYISQPALSLTIRKLEEALGYPVFERSGKAVSLTPPGEKYIRAVEKILQIQADLEKELDDMRLLQTGTLTVGCSTVISTYVLPGVLKTFMEKYPHIQVELKVEKSLVLGQLLERGEVDLVIDNTQAKREDFNYTPLFTEQILLAVPESLEVNRGLAHARVRREALDAKDFGGIPRVPVSAFRDEKFILLKPGNKMRYIADTIFREAEMHPQVVFEFDSVDTSVSFTENGFGVSFVTDIAAGACRAACLYLPETEHSRREVYAIYKKNKYLPQAAKAFIGSFSKETLHCNDKTQNGTNTPCSVKNGAVFGAFVPVWGDSLQLEKQHYIMEPST